MIKKDYTRCWKAADRRELHLIRLWEETALKPVSYTHLTLPTKA